MSVVIFKMKKNVTLRQQEIIASARSIIINEGIESLTVRRIAHVIKITDGALYKHFKSKREILSLLIDDIGETLLATIRLSSNQSDDPLEKLQNIFFSHLSYAEQRRGVSFIVISQAMSVKDRALQKKMFSVVTEYLETIKAILRDGIKRGDFRGTIDIDSASIAFLGMVQSTITIWGLSGYPPSFVKERMDSLFNIYKEGIGVQALKRK